MIPFSKANFLIIRLSLLWVLFALGMEVQAQQFTAKIEEDGNYYRLTFTLNSTDASDFTPPSLEDFKVLSGPSVFTFSNTQIVNGKASHSASTTYTYLLSPLESGKVKIGSASVRSGNRTLHSKPITADTRTSSSSGRQNGKQDEEYETFQQAGTKVTQRDLFIDVVPSKTKVWEQEAVILTYKIHARLGVGLSNTQLTRKPDFKGLISQEIPIPGNQIQTSIEHRNDGTYRTGTILEYIIFPQQSGSLEIPSITFECTVLQQDNTLDPTEAFFNGGGFRGVNLQRSVPPLTLQVEPLPEPRPANFSGAVGNFELEGRILNPSVRTNDVATYRLTLKGTGNLKLITAPVVTFPKDFDSYDAKTNEDSEVSVNGLRGELTFDYTFVPRNVGRYTIPAVEFVFFDMQSGTYKTLKTKAVTLKVEQGVQSNEDVDKQLALLRSDIRNSETLDEFGPGDALIFTWGSRTYWGLTAIFLLTFALLCFFLRDYKVSMADVTGRKRKGARKQAIARLQKAQKLIQVPDQNEFYVEVSHALYGYVADTFNLPRAQLSKEKVATLLLAKGVSQTAIDSLLAVLEACEYACFAPTAEDQRKHIYDQACEAIQSIKK